MTGRTDSGVHALQMFAHFDTERELSDDLVRKLNAFLPYDIAVHSICAVKPDAHARFDALKRTYQYHISIEKSPFRYDYSMPLTLPLNVDVMNEAAQILFDYTDFQCFSKTHTDVKTFNCKIYEAHWAVVGGELVFTITPIVFCAIWCVLLWVHLSMWDYKSSLSLVLRILSSAKA